MKGANTTADASSNIENVSYPQGLKGGGIGGTDQKQLMQSIETCVSLSMRPFHTLGDEHLLLMRSVYRAFYGHLEKLVPPRELLNWRGYVEFFEKRTQQEQQLQFQQMQMFQQQQLKASTSPSGYGDRFLAPNVVGHAPGLTKPVDTLSELIVTSRKDVITQRPKDRPMTTRPVTLSGTMSVYGDDNKEEKTIIVPSDLVAAAPMVADICLVDYTDPLVKSKDEPVLPCEDVVDQTIPQPTQPPSPLAESPSPFTWKRGTSLLNVMTPQYQEAGRDQQPQLPQQTPQYQEAGRDQQPQLPQQQPKNQPQQQMSIDNLLLRNFMTVKAEIETSGFDYSRIQEVVYTCLELAHPQIFVVALESFRDRDMTVANYIEKAFYEVMSLQQRQQQLAQQQHLAQQQQQPQIPGPREMMALTQEVMQCARHFEQLAAGFIHGGEQIIYRLENDMQDYSPYRGQFEKLKQELVSMIQFMERLNRPVAYMAQVSRLDDQQNLYIQQARKQAVQQQKQPMQPRDVGPSQSRWSSEGSGSWSTQENPAQALQLIRSSWERLLESPIDFYFLLWPELLDIISAPLAEDAKASMHELQYSRSLSDISRTEYLDSLKWVILRALANMSLQYPRLTGTLNDIVTMAQKRLDGTNVVPLPNVRKLDGVYICNPVIPVWVLLDRDKRITGPFDSQTMVKWIKDINGSGPRLKDTHLVGFLEEYWNGRDGLPQAKLHQIGAWRDALDETIGCSIISETNLFMLVPTKMLSKDSLPKIINWLTHYESDDVRSVDPVSPSLSPVAVSTNDAPTNNTETSASSKAKSVWAPKADSEVKPQSKEGTSSESDTMSDSTLQKDSVLSYQSWPASGEATRWLNKATDDTSGGIGSSGGSGGGEGESGQRFSEEGWATVSKRRRR
eukprot:GHVH01004134.1.p1 GENE.GHVH01004134.1~~GHVH01004134.1.p1  ORF type:complete len:899 (-),score=143.92 GHVH01004134.1:137-2833(-)